MSMTQTSPAVDRFSIWLLGGTGASGALLVTQIDSVLPHLSVAGFKVCLASIVLSAVFGFFSKYKALRCQIQTEVDAKLTELVAPIFTKHEKDQVEIRALAERRGLELETELNFSNVIAEFSRPFPFWIRWLINRQTEKTRGHRQAGYHNAVRAYFGQLRYAFLQAVLFLSFLIAAGWYSGPI
jgi:hypothetical protein